MNGTLGLAGIAGAVSLALQLACGNPASGQTALVLSGGGSRGLAHAGAVLGLERIGFRPDIVVGASMGAIIGGLYASGLDPDSIWAVTRAQDWQEMFSPSAVRPGPDGVPVRPMTRLGVGRDQTRYADGLIPDWRVNRELVGLFLDPAFRARGDFDALPRRFRSVASDLRTGEVVVLGSGDLARSIRASMAVPGVFAPVLAGGATLVDGGLADYLPIGPARRAGAESVIAVDVIRPPQDEVESSPFQAALRAFRLTLQNARQERDTADVLITPDIDPGLFAAIFLRDPEPLLDAGLEAALTLPDTFDGGVPARAPRPAPTTFAGLRVEANDPSLESLVRAAFTPISSAAYDREAVLEAVDGLYATGLFTGIWPRIEGGGAADTLVVFAEAFAPTTIMGAAGYDTDRGFRGWLGLSHRHGSRLEATLAASGGELETWGVASLRVRPSHAHPSIAIESGVSAEANDVRIFLDDEPIDEHQVGRLGAWSGVTWRALAPGLEMAALLSAERIDDGFSDGLAWGPTLRVSNPRPNAAIVGVPLRLDAQWRFGDFEYRLFRAAGSVGTTIGRFRAAAVADLTATRGETPVDAWPALGAPDGMPGLRHGMMRAPAVAIGGLDFAVAAPLESHIRLRVRAGTTASDLSDIPSNRWRTGAALGLVWWTPVGGVVVEAGVMDGGSWRIGLDIGPTF